MKNLIILPILLLLIAACNGGGGGGSSNKESIAIGIEGIWESCVNSSSSSISEKNVYLITDKVIQQVTTTFDGHGCVQGTEGYNYRYIMSYSISGSNVEVTIESVSSTSLTSYDVTYNNSNSYCGFNNWVINVPKNISGKDCGGTTSSVGATDTYSFTKTSNSLDFEKGDIKIHTSLSSAFDFSQRGQILSDGNYVYFDGETGIYMTLDAGVYSVFYFDMNTLRIFGEGGTYTSANNLITFTVGEYLPTNCGTNVGESFNIPFSKTSFSLALKYPNISILGEKVSMSMSEFSSAYLGQTFSLGCF
jgi:hypothetical protein